MAKSIFLVISIFLTAQVFASKNHERNGEKSMEKFQSRKQKQLEMIDKRISHLNEHKQCISAAADRKALKECRKAHQGKMKSMRALRRKGRKHSKNDE